jgi:hypothetical protein
VAGVHQTVRVCVGNRGFPPYHTLIAGKQQRLGSLIHQGVDCGRVTRNPEVLSQADFPVPIWPGWAGPRKTVRRYALQPGLSPRYSKAHLARIFTAAKPIY